MSIPAEKVSAIVMLVLLNGLLLSVNAVDFFYIWIKHNSLPTNTNLSVYVHEGVNTLITSIILAIAIILFYFRLHLNFDEAGKWPRRLACIWVGQNTFLVVSAMMRNMLYVHDWGLSEKKIGVFVYLGLCIIGLFFTLYKIIFKKNNWFLFRKNAVAFYAVLIVSCAVNWHAFMADYNVDHALHQQGFQFDAKYTASLGINSTEAMMKYLHENKKLEPTAKAELQAIVDHHLQKVNADVTLYGWPSYSYQKERLFNKYLYKHNNSVATISNTRK